MKFLVWSVIAVVLLAMPMTAVAQSGDPLEGLERLKIGVETHRESSTDPNWQKGNGDARYIAPGDTLVLADIKGPGIIRHIWNTISAGDKWYSRLLTLRMYWDGEENPSVECPIGDFFGVGHGIDVPYSSLPVAITSEGRARNCYWPMPFRKSAKITVTNDGFSPVNAFYFYIDWHKVKSLPKDTAYFHAQYRQEFPCEPGKDYLILDAEGQGHYVGTVQSVRLNENGWYGEGDDFFYIDGEKEPRLKGTGSEDYFCDAWGFRKNASPYFGVTVLEGYSEGDRVTAYRWHIPDPVTFKKSLRVEIEHWGSRDGVGGYVERADDFATVAFWYQTEPHKVFTKIPPGEQRLIFDPRKLVQFEAKFDKAKTQPEKMLQIQQGQWSGGAQLFFTPREEGGVLEIPFEASEAGNYEIVLISTISWDYGIYQASVNDSPVGGPADYYNESVSTRDIRLGKVSLKKGENLLSFKNVGKNSASKGYYFGLDAMMMRAIK